MSYVDRTRGAEKTRWFWSVPAGSVNIVKNRGIDMATSTCVQLHWTRDACPMKTRCCHYTLSWTRHMRRGLRLSDVALHGPSWWGRMSHMTWRREAETILEWPRLVT